MSNIQTIAINDTQVPVPEGAVAFKYSDPIEAARWIYDEDEATEIESIDPSLIVRVPVGQVSYTTATDARIALINSGVLEMFDYDSLTEVTEWMFRNDATPEQAAEHFEVS